MKLDQIKTYEDLEYYFNKRRKIKFDDNVKIKSKYDILHHTFNPDHSLDTYYKKGKIHCSKYKARSIVDILMLLKYYFPKSTLKLNFNYIKRFSKLIGGNGISYYYCNNIKKSNFHGVCNYQISSFNNVEKIDLFSNLVIDRNLNIIK